MIQKHIARMGGLLLLLFACLSCSESVVDLHKGETPLEMSADLSDIVLKVASMQNNALTFTWTSGTNSGTNCAIGYEFLMDVKGNNFAGGYSLDMGRKLYSLSFKHGELNSLLLDTFGGVPGTPMEMEAMIVATPTSEKATIQTTEVVSFNVTPYKPLTEHLYMIGGATPGGWSLDDAEEMNSVTGRAGQFIWNGDFSAGELKFLTTKTDYIPSYNRDPNAEGKLLYRESYDDPDEKFIIPSFGTYRVVVDLVNMTINISGEAGPRFNSLWFVGSFTNWGFVKMRRDPSNAFVFRYAEIFNWNGGGEFKFGTAAGSWDNMYHSTEANAPYTSTGVVFGGTEDNKWLLTEEQCGKPYKLYVDITEGKEKMVMNEFIPFEQLWMVGDATSGGWTIGDATPLEKTGDYTFSWTGTLTAGEMKITCDKRLDWMGAWFMSSTESEAPTGEEQIMTFVDKQNDPAQSGIDRKWKIAEEGTYEITLNQLYEVITISKR